MRLSEAIRLGALLHPQAFGEYYKVDEHGVRQTCALGAAHEAIGDPLVTQTADETFDYLPSGPIQCPVCKRSYRPKRIVAHLNDDHRWTREAIADWVEQQEAPVVIAIAPEPDLAVAR